MTGILPLTVAFLVCVLPGLAVLLAIGVQRPLALLALAVPISVAVAAVTATAAAVLGLSFGAWSTGLVTVIAGAVAIGRLVRSGRGISADPDFRRWTANVTVWAGTVLAVAGAVVAVLTWTRALGGIDTYPQEHDTVIHTVVTAYISRTGRAAPWQLLPADLLTGDSVFFYPAGMHMLAAVTADVVGDPVVGLNAVTVVLLAVVFCVSAVALTIIAGRRLKWTPGSIALAAGAASLVAAGLYRPAFQLAHDGGALPNAAALTMTGCVVAGLLLLSESSRATAVAVGLACAGIVFVHPSAAASVGVTALVWWIGDAVTRETGTELRRLVVPTFVAGSIAAVIAAPLAVAAVAAAGRTTAFPPDIGPAGYADAIGSTLGLAYGGYLDPSRSTGQMWAAVMAVLGVVAVLVTRRGYGVILAWGVWVTITISFFLSPATGFETPITSVFYKAMVRVWSHVSVVVPVLAGIGFVFVASSVLVIGGRWVSKGRLPFRLAPAAALLTVLLVVAYAVGPSARYVERNTEALASRYGQPAFVRVDDDDRNAAAWLASRVRPGQRVMNNANDGSTLLYVEYGIPVINISTLGLSNLPYTYQLLESFNQFPTDAAVRDSLVGLDVAWVYVDTDAPIIGSGGSPDFWTDGSPFSVAPGLGGLDGLPGVRREFSSGSVSIYSVNPAAATPAE